MKNFPGPPVFSSRSEEGGAHRSHDNDEHLIDGNLEWSMLEKEENSDTSRAFYAKLEEDKDNIAHLFQQFGFIQSKCRNELKRFSQEIGTHRDPESMTRLIDFAKVFLNIFDCLWSEFSLIASAT